MISNSNRIVLLLLAGFSTALGGMLKDAPYEGFELLKFFRSPIIALTIGLPLIYFFPTLELKYLLFSVWGGERIVSEYYKKIIRGMSPGKFKVDAHQPKNKDWLAKRKKNSPSKLGPTLRCLRCTAK